MTYDLGIMAISIAVLAIASEKFVTSSRSISRKIGLSDLLAGVVIVGFASSLPEIATSVLASFSGHPDIALSQVVGSTTINVTIVSAISALAATPLIPLATIKREGAAAVTGALALFVVVALGGQRFFGPLLIVMFVVFTILVLKGAEEHRIHAAQQAKHEVIIADDRPSDIKQPSPSRELIVGLAALVLTLVAAEGFLKGALALASRMGISGGFVGGVILAFGASLPEIATAIQAARKGAAALVVGNVLGASYLTCTLAAGLTLSIRPLSTPRTELASAAVMATSLCLLWVFLLTGRRLNRLEGIFLIVFYGVFLATLGG